MYCVSLPDSDLADFCLLPGRRAPKFVKLDVKPFINVTMYLVVLVADLLRGQSLLQSLQGNHTMMIMTTFKNKAIHDCHHNRKISVLMGKPLQNLQGNHNIYSDINNDNNCSYNHNSCYNKVTFVT